MIFSLWFKNLFFQILIARTFANLCSFLGGRKWFLAHPVFRYYSLCAWGNENSCNSGDQQQSSEIWDSVEQESVLNIFVQYVVTFLVVKN